MWCFTHSCEANGMYACRYVLICVPQFAFYCCQNHHNQKDYLERRGLIGLASPNHSSSLRAGTWRQKPKQDHGGTLLTGWLPVASQPALSYHPGRVVVPTAGWIAYYISHYSGERSTDLPDGSSLCEVDRAPCPCSSVGWLWTLQAGFIAGT